MHRAHERTVYALIHRGQSKHKCTQCYYAQTKQQSEYVAFWTVCQNKILIIFFIIVFITLIFELKFNSKVFKLFFVEYPIVDTNLVFNFIN